MKKINEMTIRDIENTSLIQISYQDMSFVIRNKTKEQIRNELNEIKKEEKKNRREQRETIREQERFGVNFKIHEDVAQEDAISHTRLIKYLEENEENVDKRMLILISLNKYINAQNIINDINNPSRNSLINQREEIEEGVRKTKKLAKELLKDEKNIFICRKAIRDGKYVLDIISSKDLLQEIPAKGERKRERENIKAIHMIPDEALVSALILANGSKEIEETIFKIPSIGENLMDVVIENAIASEHLTQQEISEFLEKSDESKNSTIEKIKKLSPEVKETLKGLEKYIDMDKMCLNTIMNIILNSENGSLYYTDGNCINGESVESGQCINLERYLKYYYDVIKDKQVEIEIEGKKYTTEDAKKAMEKYVDGKYMSDFTVNDMIYNLLQSEQSVSGMSKKQIAYIRQYIIDKRGVAFNNELKNMIKIGLMDEKAVIDMYENRKLSIENILSVKEFLNLDKLITPKFTIEKFRKLYELNDKENAYEKETIKRYMDLYKLLYLIDKSNEEVIKAGEELLKELEKENQEDIIKREQEGLLGYKLISDKTFTSLADKGIISMDNLMDKYQKGFIKAETIKELKKEGVQLENLDVEQYVIDSYMKIREQDNADLTELKKYISLYKTLKLDDLQEEEKKESADELVMRIGERIENDIEAGKQKKEFGKDDRKKLYELDAIPIDTVVLWAEKGEITNLLNSKTLIPKDIRRLYRDKRIILHDIQEIVESKDVRLEQKISLINMVFSSPEDMEIRNQLFQRITDLDITTTSEEEHVHRGKSNSKTARKCNRHLFDTAVRYNAWIESDKDVKMEILNDGHIAAHLPNVKDGIVCIEQFYKLKKEKNGRKSMEDAYGVKGYVLPEDIYQECRNQFVTKDNRVIRSELAKKVKEIEPILEERGIIGELYHYKSYPEVVQKLIGIPDNLSKAKTDKEKEKALKTLEDSEQYTTEEKENILKINKAWEEVRKSRSIYDR